MYLGQGRLDFDRDLLDELDHLPPERPELGEDTAQASIDALLSSVGHFRTPGEYRAMLEFVSTFPLYAPFNRMLVRVQDPGARYVATPARWWNDYDRHVRPAARPIVLLQPGGPVMFVFDVRDTEPGVESPRLVPDGVSDPLAIRFSAGAADISRRWATMVENAIRDGIRVQFGDHGGHSGGFACRSEGSGRLIYRERSARKGAVRPEREAFAHEFDIVVNKNLSEKDQLATLVHELAHIYCGHVGGTPAGHWPDRQGVPRTVEELEAESIVHMVLSRIDPGVQMGDYIQGHLDAAAQVPPGVSLNVMMRAAGTIEDMCKGPLPRRKPRKR